MVAVKDFKKEVIDWSEEVGISPKEIHVRAMKNKWASCSSRGRLTFSFALLNEPYDVRANAVVHELLHLRYPNHGKMFKSMLVSHLRRKGIDSGAIKF